MQCSAIYTHIFQLTPSRRATQAFRLTASAERHFNSRPHGGRLTLRFYEFVAHYFNSRPHGGRPICFFNSGLTATFQLTPSRRATQRYFPSLRKLRISTHALTEGDWARNIIIIHQCKISTHALTEGDEPCDRRCQAR